MIFGYMSINAKYKGHGINKEFTVCIEKIRLILKDIYFSKNATVTP